MDLTAQKAKTHLPRILPNYKIDQSYPLCPRRRHHHRIELAVELNAWVSKWIDAVV